MKKWNISYLKNANIASGIGVASIAILSSSFCYAADGGGGSFWDRLFSFVETVVPKALDVISKSLDIVLKLL